MTLILPTFASVLTELSIYEIAARLTHPISLAAFALAIILGILLLKQKVPAVVWFLIALLVIGPIAISAYLEIVKQRTSDEAIYQVRVTVMSPEGTPTDEAKVWSSIGGEAKKVPGGWQFDIAKASKPKDGKLIINASQSNRFLVGEEIILLGDDYHPNVRINLKSEQHVQVRGQVVDGRSRAVEGARVLVVGYANEAVVTDATGGFVLPAHAAKDQDVLLHIERQGYSAKEQSHPAGNFPAVIILDKK